MSHKTPFSIRRLLNLVCLLIFFSLILNCEKESIIIPSEEPAFDPPATEDSSELIIPLRPELTDPETPDTETVIDTAAAADHLSREDSISISKLPAYYRFLTTLKESGYSFMDFATYIHADNSSLPQKLLVIRHDVHSRDIKWAYHAYRIEKVVIGSGKSTFYIMLNDPIEVERGGSYLQKQYMDFIHYLDSRDVDIQPHVSPVDLYIEHAHPTWEHFTLDTLETLFKRNYRWNITSEGRRLEVTFKDVFRMNDFNNWLKELLPEYNRKWTAMTNREVKGYAAHGSATTMNRVINNAHLLDQFVLLDEGIYEYDTYNSQIFSVLTYLSDNSLPKWMTNPGSIAPGRYQFLMHPYQWAHLR